jgi:hypothetical protein
MRLLAAALAAATTLAAASTPAAACSLAGPYRIPTNLELAEQADTIVLGTVEGEEGAPPGQTWVIVRPTLLLKGRSLPGEVRFEAAIAPADEKVTRSNPRELFRPNPDVQLGSCNRFFFDRRMQLVLFLVRGRKGVLEPIMPAFSRAAEDVPSADALWVKAVRLYAEASALPKRARRAFLRARRDALRAAPDADSHLLADDIDRQLARTEPRLID